MLFTEYDLVFSVSRFFKVIQWTLTPSPSSSLSLLSFTPSVFLSLVLESSANIKERTEAEVVVVEQGAVENIWVLKEEATSGWRKLSYEELHDLCPLPDVIRAMK